MIERLLQPRLLDLATRYPVLTLTGPRQSGKTTLSRMAFPDLPYVSLENPAQREFAQEDPVAFLARYRDGAIIDEVQRVPQIFSYLQGMVDEDPRPGRFLLTGSQNLALVDAVTQSLAGRTTLTELLPLSLEEVRRFPDPPADLDTLLWQGGYPRIYERSLPAHEWLADYTATYVERDVRQLVKVGDLLLFQTFLRLCAGRTGQILNLSSLANDCGISQPTARSWLSVLEASYIVFRLPPFFANLGKRLIKSPKLYFYDAGLAADLLNVENPRQLENPSLAGSPLRDLGRRPRSPRRTSIGAAGRGSPSIATAADWRSIWSWRRGPISCWWRSSRRRPRPASPSRRSSVSPQALGGPRGAADRRPGRRLRRRGVAEAQPGRAPLLAGSR